MDKPRSLLLVCIFCILGIFNLSFSMKANSENPSPFGVCVDLYDCRDQNVTRLIKEAGIGWVRQQIRWDLIEPEKGKFNWENFDMVVENEYKQGVSAYGQLHWKSWSDPTTGDDSAIANWANFVSLAVKRYKNKIRYWEVWNEPDCEMFWKPLNAANYVKLLKATYIAAKKADPTCKIILGGVMGWGGDKPYFTFIDDIYNNGGKGYFDIMAIHPYTMPSDPNKDNLLRRKMEDVLERMKRNNDGNKPIWVTEIGWPSNKLLDPRSDRGVTPDEQANYLVEALKICFSYPQVKKVFWYCFRDIGTYPFDSEHHYGLIKNNFIQKPSYVAYKNLTANRPPSGK